MNNQTKRQPTKIGDQLGNNLRSFIGAGTFNPTQTENDFAKTNFSVNPVPVQQGTQAADIKALEIKKQIKPGDYGKVKNAHPITGEEKEIHHYTLKAFWKESSNGKNSYVFTGQNCYDTYLKNRRIYNSVFLAMVAKFNEKIIQTEKLILYDNSEYGRIVKLAEYDGIKIHLDEKVKSKLRIVNNRLSII